MRCVDGGKVNSERVISRSRKGQRSAGFGEKLRKVAGEEDERLIFQDHRSNESQNGWWAELSRHLIVFPGNKPLSHAKVHKI